MNAAILIMSDKSSSGEREDASGPVIENFVGEGGGEIKEYRIIPDDYDRIVKELNELSEIDDVEIIFTSGGTGFAPRDITPEATSEVIEKEVPGLPEKMRADTSKFTELTYLSRAKAGIKGDCLIVNLPGKPEAVEQCLESVIDIIPHGLDILRGSITEH